MKPPWNQSIGCPLQEYDMIIPLGVYKVPKNFETLYRHETNKNTSQSSGGFENFDLRMSHQNWLKIDFRQKWAKCVVTLNFDKIVINFTTKLFKITHFGIQRLYFT